MSLAVVMSPASSPTSSLSKQRRAFTLSRGRTTVNVEGYVLDSFDAMCKDLGMSPRIVADMIDQRRDRSETDDFTNAFRVAVLAYWRSVAERRRIAPPGHLSAAMTVISGATPADPSA